MGAVLLMTPDSFISSHRSFPLARALPDSRENRDATVFGRDVVDQFLNDDGLSNAGSSEQADFPAFQIRLDEINDLDSCLKHLELSILFDKRRRQLMDGFSSREFDWTQFVDGLTDDVNDAAEGPFTDGYRHRPLEI